MLGAYSGPKDDTSMYRSFLLSEPIAVHVELPEGMDEDCIEPFFVEAIPAHSGAPEHWIRDEIISYEKPVDDSSWAHFLAVEEVQGSPARWDLRENAELVLFKRQDKANSNLEQIRKLRNELLASCDIEIFKREDNGDDASFWREYRIALRNCTEVLKDGDVAKLSCENLVPSEFVFPTKPIN